MSLNDWLEETVRLIPRWTLDPPSPLISDFASLFSLVLFFSFSTFSLYSLSFGAEAVSINLINFDIRNVMESIKSSRGNRAPSRNRRDIRLRSRPRISRRGQYLRALFPLVRCVRTRGTQIWRCDLHRRLHKGHREGNGPLRRPFICRPSKTFDSAARGYDRPDGKPFLIFYKTETEQRQEGRAQNDSTKARHRAHGRNTRQSQD